MNKTINIAIFASGAGSNAAKIIEHFKSHAHINISLLLCNKSQAGAFDVAARNNIPSLRIDKIPFFESDTYINKLKQYNIGLIVLAGFLWKVPKNLIDAFPERIINIHPALLPKFGGKGMYGHFVHQAVVDAQEDNSGITIHLVDEQYDHGKHLFQAQCIVTQDDTADTLAQKVHMLEHKYFPITIEKYCQKLLSE